MIDEYPSQRPTNDPTQKLIETSIIPALHGKFKLHPVLPQNSFKTVAPSPPPTSVSKPSFTPNSPDHLTFLYRNHKALLESVKKEQVNFQFFLQDLIFISLALVVRADSDKLCFSTDKLNIVS